jgi:hypothetical protein
MSLSISKLQLFANNNNYEIHKIFVKNGRCFMVEMMSIKTIDYILIYIPDKYKFEIPNEYPTYSLVEIHTNDSRSDDIDEYTHVSEALIESSYSEMESVINLPIERRKNLSMSEHLDQSYLNVQLRNAKTTRGRPKNVCGGGFQGVLR